MLDTLRRNATGLLAKILIGLLVLSFAVWGIADVFTGYRQGEVAKVGDIEITANEFQETYNREVSAFSRRLGQQVTPEQARLFGIERRVLESLIGGAALDNHADALNLGLSDEAVAKDIRDIDAFKSPTGSFDKSAFENFLREVRLSEQGFVQMRRREILRSQLTDALVTGLKPAKPILDLIHAYHNETRKIEYVTIDPKTLPKVPEPTEKQLTDAYEANKAKFVTPEFRKANVLLATSEVLKDRITVDDKVINAYYTANKERYNDPEQRQIQQLSFPDKAKAEAAKKAIAGGKSFVDVAKENGAQESDIDLGLMTKAQLIDPKVAEAAFSLKTDEVSEVVEGQFAPVLLRVTKIVEGKRRGLDDVKDQIKEILISQRVRAKSQEYVSQVDELRLSGKSLKEIAAALKLRHIEGAKVNNEGKTPEGKNAFETNDAQRLVQGIFATEVGLENEPLTTTDGGHIWYDTIEITPEKQRPFAEVKTEVADLWKKQEQQKALTKFASDLVARANNGEAMSEIAKAAGGKLATTDYFKRDEKGGGLPPNAVTRAFAMTEGKAAFANTINGDSRVVLKLLDVKAAPKPTPLEAEQLAEQMTRAVRTDALAAYIAALQKRYEVNINKAALQRVTGLQTQ